ncbi:hypothetical protein DQ384_29070 [Sphaerisporangium album]|uniref:Uncharacterized protein n=1 Tax=Sphaerisporangium album TaxID=509200 RepID=A0A367F9Y8_9ACTN|nr:fatty acyl-AMP ligase [Sphaerisporangium album]RCG26497.1 hypothetical protein DQ384_29070 [Sphaerisporangium album]
MPDLAGRTAQTLVHLLRTRAADRPEHIPHVYSEYGDKQNVELSYQRLDQNARAVAARLAGLCSPGDRVLLLYPPGLEFNAGFWGCLYAGVIGVPVAPPQLSKLEAGVARMRAIAANSDARVLLTDSPTAERLREALPLIGGFEHVRILATDDLQDGEAEEWRPVSVSGNTVAYLQYSSGSTGAPKGVALTHASVLANLRVIGTAVGITEESRVVSWLPTFHDMGLISAVLLPISADITTFQMAPLAFVQRPHRWLRMIAEVGATTSVAPNFAYDLCVRRITEPQMSELDLSGWDAAMCGAEPIRPATLDRFADMFAVCGFRRQALYPCYGLAETTLMVTGGPLGTGMRTAWADPDALASDRFRRDVDPRHGRLLASSGGMLAGMQVRIADAESLEVLPDGRIGGIFVSGDSVAQGYWNNPEATADCFNVRLNGAEGLFLSTGDLGFLQDGQLWVTGRRKDLIIVDGGNHYPQDIEATAAASHPAVQPNGCAAFQFEDGALGLVVEVNRRYRVATHLQPAADGGSVVLSAELEQAIRQSVSVAHNLRVDRLYLVRPRTIPLTSSGKIQRNLCRTLALDGALEERSAVAEQRAAADPVGRL